MILYGKIDDPPVDRSPQWFENRRIDRSGVQAFLPALPEIEEIFAIQYDPQMMTDLFFDHGSQE